ncbi:hypothetical protein [Exiguobacterium qingdaonense]|uniref:hypothetical protein n=1 Tax=Exiguobacterium qingdaonense TaxID=2751251 RepID=UPI001BEA5853|nr:hypothetical protein [Exiguobacterium qingdaonense]
MKKSWVTLFLPNDEYKERQLLYFIAEAFVLFIGLLGVAGLLNKTFSTFHAESLFILLIIAVTLSLYVWIRYIVSGMEYANVVEKSEYKIELRKLIGSTSKFAVLFAGVAIALKLTGVVDYSWMDLLGMTLLSYGLLLVAQFVSLQRSVRKNRELS